MRSLILLLLLPAAAALKPVVSCVRSGPAVLGGNVSLTCDFPYRMDVLQVTWEKKRGAARQNMVTHSRKYGVRIAEAFDNLVRVLQADASRSSITISKLEREDEACYICIFNTYPDGAFTGEVCLTHLVPSNEVTCRGRGKHLHIIMTPTEIMARQSQLGTKSMVEGSAVQKGLYIDGNIHPVCTFQVLEARRKNRSLQANHGNSTEGLNEVIITQCSASGWQRPVITWGNEENVVSREEKSNTTNNITTVTSTLHHSVSSLSTDFRVTCNIKQEPAPAAPLTHVMDSPGEVGTAGYSQVTKEKWDHHRLSSICRSVIVCVAVLVILLVSSYAFHRLRTKSPLSNSNNIYKDEICIKRGEVTPSNSTKKSDRSDQGSSVTKRNPSSIRKENIQNIQRRLDYNGL
ncbi:uncharacterized protein LOC134988164 isoform X2 [Pseudophryne corroboree]|uniref:uncharacterized protein LOC134988164 isoform X2 n=1 Tax=Pseudophryne corroboree TaxID=495146 RepID=UPI00308127CE